MASPFEVYAGSHQQRVPTPFPAGTGWAFELGHASHLQIRIDPNAADSHELSQTFTLSAGASVIRLRVRIATPPVSVAWRFGVYLNGDAHYTRDFEIANRVVVLDDVTVRLAGANAPPATNVLALRLERL
jgi:hypothetical protein